MAKISNILFLEENIIHFFMQGYSVNEDIISLNICYQNKISVLTSHILFL